MAYGYLWFSLLLSIAVYSVDTFTAIQLLVFNKWSSEIEPTQLIPFDVSKWIFSICIILSFVNLGFEHVRAQRIMRRGSVAESYLDNLTIKLQSIRLGKGQGWKRFLVFAELTKNKKGAEYVALFSYYSFQCKRFDQSESVRKYLNLTVTQLGSVLFSALALDRPLML